MNNIPKPVKEKPIAPDKSMEFLIEWKRLFEAIDPEIKVTIDKLPEYLAEDQHSSVKFEPKYHEPKIHVILPGKFNLRYLIGLPHNEMFSDLDVLGDSDYHSQEGDAFDCMPKTHSWEFYYNELVKTEENSKQEIPEPPK